MAKSGSVQGPQLILVTGKSCTSKITVGNYLAQRLNGVYLDEYLCADPLPNINIDFFSFLEGSPGGFIPFVAYPQLLDEASPYMNQGTSVVLGVPFTTQLHNS